ncbi:MAG: CPBP family intramembrane metalloprotease [Cellulosilyticum sp.]|nr:CPBP family intramembrane metalloprotease [Cellulosilyticum sp.]
MYENGGRFMLLKEGTFIEEAKQAKFQPNVILQIIIFIGLVIGLQIGTGIILGILYIILGVDFTSIDNALLQLAGLYMTIIPMTGVILYCRYIEKRSLTSMGFVRKGAVKQYLIGFGVGILFFSAAVGVTFLLGGVQYQGFTLGKNTGWILVFLFAWLFQGMEEEVLLRGYLMTSLSNKIPLWAAVLINSVGFSALHLFNSGISILAVINLCLFGLFASVYTVKTNNIWGIGAFHSAWNFVQGNIYGILVSGTSAGSSVLVFEPKGDSFISGGTFGLEGGIAVTILFSIAIIGLLVWKGKTVEHAEEIYTA